MTIFACLHHTLAHKWRATPKRAEDYDQEMADHGLTHLDDTGAARMVDVSGKASTKRVAVAKSTVRMLPETAKAISGSSIAKGDVLAVARVAGIQAAKKTSELIPLCHPLALTSVAVEIEVGVDAAVITATAETLGPTGVEMEALTAASVTALTIYDMCKAIDRAISIEDTHLVAKTGGKSGDWQRQK